MEQITTFLTHSDQVVVWDIMPFLGLYLTFLLCNEWVLANADVVPIPVWLKRPL